MVSEPVHETIAILKGYLGPRVDIRCVLPVGRSTSPVQLGCVGTDSSKVEGVCKRYRKDTVTPAIRRATSHGTSRPVAKSKKGALIGARVALMRQDAALFGQVGHDILSADAALAFDKVIDSARSSDGVDFAITPPDAASLRGLPGTSDQHALLNTGGPKLHRRMDVTFAVSAMRTQ